MSLSDLIASHLPHLRRFARALTGSQAGGDAYVAQFLESLIEDGASFPREGNLRLALYKNFMRIWASVRANKWQDMRPAAGLTGVDRNIASITPQSRQAFLLRYVEGFTVPETAEILGVPVEEAERLLHKADQEIAQQVATDVMIIEDEPILAIDLTTILEELGHRVVAVARTRDEVRQIMSSTRPPGLVLADIHLADGSSGLDAVNDMLTQIEVPVIFVTAYPERLLTGKKPEPAFLLTKPYQPESLKVTVCQALFFDQRARRAA
jgi:DNA-directed RNA polymerase specialized sigma24 family protein